MKTKYRETAYYTMWKDEAKAEAKRYRDMGYNAHVVPVAGNKYARGYKGGGFHVEVETSYFDAEEAKRLRKYIEVMPSRIEAIRIECKRQVAHLEEENQKYIDRLNFIVEKMEDVEQA